MPSSVPKQELSHACKFRPDKDVGRQNRGTCTCATRKYHETIKTAVSIDNIHRQRQQTPVVTLVPTVYAETLNSLFTLSPEEMAVRAGKHMPCFGQITDQLVGMHHTLSRYAEMSPNEQAAEQDTRDATTARSNPRVIYQMCTFPECKEPMEEGPLHLQHCPKADEGNTHTLSMGASLTCEETGHGKDGCPSAADPTKWKCHHRHRVCVTHGILDIVDLTAAAIRTACDSAKLHAKDTRDVYYDDAFMQNAARTGLFCARPVADRPSLEHLLRA